LALVTGVDTPAVTVSDMEKALAFYRDLLGMEVVEVKGVDSPWSLEEQERWHAYHEKVSAIPGARIQAVFLRAEDGSHLELIEYRTPKAEPARRALSDPGTAIIPFACRDSLSVVAKLREAGVEVVADPVRYVLDGVTSYTTYFRDPDGNALCLFEVVSEADA
jgi:catechol 2,3-dioxygenase-like lactoylglutathione lyase family enzyme